ARNQTNQGVCIYVPAISCSEEDRESPEIWGPTGLRDRPFAYAQQLRDQARRWLAPKPNTLEGVIDQVVLERFIEGLPARTSTWVRYHRSAAVDLRLVRSEALVEASSVPVGCIHGDVHEYPLENPAVSSSLTHPLGLDWAGFPQAVRGTRRCEHDR
uniref:SCAN box domain-containing protein n=1 Tax=Gadus morhua TaxID=8049 RepID=A0A8C5D165_GADMO